MKLSFLLTVIGVFQLNAAIFSQGARYDVFFSNMELRDIFIELENETDYRFFYSENLLDLKKKVDLDVKEASIDEIVKSLLSDVNLTYRIFEKKLVVITSKEIFVQEITVKGRITDTDGNPLPGVNIVEKGTINGAVTNLDGEYSISVSSPNAVLSFSYIGFLTEEIEVAGKSIIDLQLTMDVTTLDEVVVVGYGQMKRTDLTGSVVSVSSDAIDNSVSTSVDQVLQGRAAGVQVQQNSGAPGASTSIRIRGINSLHASNEPIFVIDGVIIDGSTESGTENALSSINPADIVSMDILKDASATAIYGSRAANGVIIITTKQGQKGEPRVTYSGYYGWQEMPQKLDLLNLQEYAELKNVRSDLGIVEKDNNFVRTDLLGEGTDWQEELFTEAAMQSHNLSVSGGSERNTYALGGGYLNQDGIALGSGFERYNLRGNLDSQVKDFLKVGLNFALSSSKQKTTVSDDNLIKIALKQTPNVAVRNADGSFDGPDTDEYVQTNPVGLAMLKDNENEKAGIRANTFAEATIARGLTFKTEYAMNYGVTNTYTFNPSYTFGAIVNSTREGSRSKSFSKYWSVRNILTFSRSFNNHNLNLMLGQEMQRTHWEYLYGYRSGYLTNGSTDLSAGDATTARNSNSSGTSAISSFMGRAFYSFNNKYLLTTTLRYDGSSKFHEDNRWGLFPSAALAWKISNESFLQGNPFIDNLKLRLGWGTVGNQNVPDNAYTSTYATVATAKWGTGLLAENTANKDLEWETTYSSNLGIDLNMFHNRIEFIADVYYKKTKNLLLELPLPAYVGTSGQGSTSAPWVNIGSLENKGIEFTLNTVNLNKGDFMWRSNFVFSLNRNEVLSLDTETSIINKTLQEGSDITIITRTAVGEAIGQFYGYKVIGRFEKATDFYYKNENGEVVPVALPEGLEIGENSIWIGDYIFEDVNDDGVINEEDRTFIGNPEPDFTYGIGNTLSYKGFDLNIFLTGCYGNEVVNYQRRFLENGRESTNLLQSALGYARLELIDPDGPNDYRNVQIVGGDPYMPRIGASSASSTSNFRFSDKFVEDGSYLRIQSISLAYNFPHKWISKMRIENLKVYTKLQNVYTFTEYTGYDPEIGSLEQDALMTGIDNARYPSPRIYTFGLNVTF